MLPYSYLFFLSEYTVIDNQTKYVSRPKDKITITIKETEYFIVPAEKILIFKLIGRRMHHQDIEDVKNLIKTCRLDFKLFWKLVDAQNARDKVQSLLDEYKLTGLIN